MEFYILFLASGSLYYIQVSKNEFEKLLNDLSVEYQIFCKKSPEDYDYVYEYQYFYKNPEKTKMHYFAYVNVLKEDKIKDRLPLESVIYE